MIIKLHKNLYCILWFILKKIPKVHLRTLIIIYNLSSFCRYKFTHHYTVPCPQLIPHSTLWPGSALNFHWHVFHVRWSHHSIVSPVEKHHLSSNSTLSKKSFPIFPQILLYQLNLISLFPEHS